MSVPGSEQKKKAPEMFSDEWFEQVTEIERPSLKAAARKAFGLTSPRMRHRKSAREKLGLPFLHRTKDDLLEAAIVVVYYYKDAPCMQSERGRKAMKRLEEIAMERGRI